MKKNGLASRIISLLVTFVFLFTLVPTVVLADTTAYTMSLLCENDTIKEGETGTLIVKLDGPMADISFVQYSVAFNDEYASITANSERKPECFDQDWFDMIKDEEELGYIATPSAGINNGALNVTFLSTSLYYIDSDAPNDFYNAKTTMAGIIKFTAVKDIENPAEVFTLTNCKISHIDDDEATKVPTVQIPDKAVSNVMNLIDAIGTVELTDACLGKITDAETAYGNLSDAQKAKVTNYSKLTQARASYDALVKEAKEKAAEVDELIEKIGTVVFTEDSMKAIATARETYWTLSSEEKNFVTKLDALKTAEEEFMDLLGTEISDISDILTPIYEIGINRIKPSEYDIVNTAYKAAKERYDLLFEIYVFTEQNGGFPITQRIYERVMNLGYKLIEIEDVLEDVEAEIKKIEAVEALIEQIGDVTLDSKEAIETAEAAYEELGNNKVYVKNIALLTTARETYDRLEEEQIAIDEVIKAIEDIGDVTLDSEDAINYARGLYDALDDDLESKVTNKNLLDEAEAKLASLKRIKDVEDKIDAIGTVTLDSIEAIKLAEAAYWSDIMSDEERDKVSNRDVLFAARAEYDILKKAEDKEVADKKEAGVVINMIANLAEMEIDLSNDDYATALAQAEAAYEGLTDDQKVYVENYGTLTEARATYNAIKNVYDKIASIGEVIYTESNEKIVDARDAYNALDDTLKEKVTNYSTLVKAEARYIELGKINAVIVLIESIGDVSYTETCRIAIETADEAYKNLDENLKSEITAKYALLLTAKETYKSLAPIVSESGLVADYGNNHVLVLTNIEKGMYVTVNGNEAMQIIAGENVYYVLVSSEPIEEKNIIVDDTTATQSEVQTLGDVDGKDGIDVIDAQLALKKAVHITDAVFENDPMAYVRADVNGNGTFTARDAYLIAMAFLDSATADNFKVYTK